MAVGSLGQLTVDLVANTAGFERGMNQAERALASATRETKRQGEALDRLIGQIDPTVAAYSRLDKMEQQLEAHRKAGRLPTEDYKVYVAQINAARDAIGKTDKVMAANGQTAKAYAANLRGVPAQFTDIAVSLQAGQNPLTVFLQQGGQLKDMFGGIAPAARALTGYIVGLINPFTVAAAAAATLALAYKQGSDETTAFSSALALTGNTAGTTTGQLASLAQQISMTGGTVGKASAVLAQLAASTRIPKESFEQIAVAAIAFEKATGQAAEETVKNFEKIAKDPTAEILRLNETMNFLTASTYEQIKALQDQGNVTAAAQVANDAYEAALARTSESVKSNLGVIETGWNAVKSAAKAAWDAALNIGREDTLDQQLQKLNGQLDAIANARRLSQSKGDGFSNLQPSDSFREDALQAEKTQLLVKKAEDDRRAASKGFQQEQQAQALRDQVDLDKLRKETETNADKRARELGQYRELVERRVTAARASGDKSLLISAEQQAKDIANINEKYKDPKVAKTPAYREDAGMKMLDNLRQQAAALQVQNDSIDEQTGKYKTLGVQAKALAAFEQQINDIKGKDVRTADQKSILANEELLRAQLKRNVALEQEIAARKQATEEAGKLAAFQENQASKIASAREANQQQLEGLGMGDKARDRLKEMLSIQRDYQKEQDKLEEQRSKGQITKDRYDEETEIIKESLATRLVDQQDYYNQVDEASSNMFLGLGEAWNNYLTQATDVAGQTESLFGNAFSGLTDSLYAFVTTGKLSFSDLATSFAQTALKMLIQYAAAQAIAAGLNAFTSTAAIPVVGPLAAPAAAASALAYAGGLSASIAGLAGMAHDGIDSVPADGTWLLQKGERVTTAQTSAKLDQTLNNISSTSNMGGTTVNLIEDASRAGQSQERTGDQGEKMIDVFVADLLGDGRTKDAMANKFGLRSVGS